MHRLARLLILVCLLGPAPILWAPCAAEAADAEVRAAQRRIQRGARRFKAGDYEGALALFLEAAPMARSLGDPAGLWFNIGRCLEELGREEEAIEAFQRYLEFPDQPGTRARARNKIKAMARRIYGALEIACPPGVTVALRGQTPRRCPFKLGPLKAGAVSLEARDAEAGLSWLQPAEVKAGAIVRVLVQKPGRLTVEPEVPGARVLLDGRILGNGRVSVTLPPGRYRLRVEAEGRRPYEQPIEVVAGESLSLSPELSASGAEGEASAARVVGWSLAGASAAAAVGGLLFYQRASLRFDEAETANARFKATTDPVGQATQRARAEDALDQGRDARTVTYLLWGASAALAAASLWTMMKAPSDGDSRVDLAPAAGPDGWGLTLSGRF